MKILIAYASAGAGHFKAASAIQHYIKENCPSVNLELVDVLEKTNALFRFFYGGGYSFLIRHVPLLWRLFFWLTDFKPFSFVVRPLGFMINLLNSGPFVELLIGGRFDCVISTHFFPAEIAGYLKRSQKIHSRLGTVITDFGVHGFWVSEGTDVYFVATEATKSILEAKGAPAHLIKNSGIPTEPGFLKSYDLGLLHQRFQTDPRKFTVLIIAGSFGIGPIEKIVDLLHRDVQLLVGCAGNDRLLAALRRRNYPGMQVFGYVNCIPEFMAISDCIVTKPGGMTISESLAKGLFPVFMTAIPGQEVENIKVLSSYGIGVYSKKVDCLRDIILDLKLHPEKLKGMKTNMQKLSHQHAAREIVHAVCQDRPGCSC